MKKYSFLCAIVVAGLAIFSCSEPEETISEKSSEENPSSVNVTTPTKYWKQIFSDEFNSTGNFDSNKWSYSARGASAWSKYLTSNSNYAKLDGNNLVLRMDNAVIPGDNVPYHSGGIQTRGKFDFRYGMVQVRAKFTQGQGSWPGIWMIPASNTYGTWPNSGEIDIMEHVNYENVVHHTLHNASVSLGGGGLGHASSFNVNQYNIYAMVWTPDYIEFYVNGVWTHKFNRPTNSTWSNWPYDQPFYLILNQSGGAGWPGPITNADLPFTQHVDYVRVYKKEEILNTGFETASIYPWTTWGSGTTSVVATSNARSGSYAIRETGGTTSAEQVVTGLYPNTTYVFGGFAKVGGSGQSVAIGVKNYGGSQISRTITSTSYQNGQMEFTTGPTNTSATIYFYKPNSGTAYGDDFYMHLK